MTMKQILKKYSKYIEDYEYDEECTYECEEVWYWVYLKEPYETDYGTTSIHDNLNVIEMELADIKDKYERK